MSGDTGNDPRVQAAIDAVLDDVRALREPDAFDPHRRHGPGGYWALCIVCQRDVPAIVRMALTAADAAVDTVAVDREALRDLLREGVGHCHRVPGQWDDGSGRCRECDSWERLRCALGEVVHTSYQRLPVLPDPDAP